MNFLALCQRAAVECGAAPSQAIGSMMPTTSSAPGSLGRIVSWVGDSWNELQMEHDDWQWMRSSNILGAGVSFGTISGKASYPLGAVGVADFTSDFSSDFGALTGTVGVAVDSFGKWDRDSFRNFSTAVGFTNEMFLDEIPFDRWRNSYMLGAMRKVATRPNVIAIGPDQSLNLGPPPDGNYTVTGDYFMAPSLLVNDTDIPLGLPTRFHMLIVYSVMRKYAGYESAPEVFQRGSSEFSSMFARLEALRLIEVTMGGALA